MSRRQSNAKPEGLSQLNLNAAGIDVDATSHFVAVPADRAEPPVREFEALRRTCTVWRTGWPSVVWRPWSWSPPAWCGDRGHGVHRRGVETVVMESTGVYWIPLFGVLEEPPWT